MWVCCGKTTNILTVTLYQSWYNQADKILDTNIPA